MNEPSAIPWYRSPVYISTLAQGLSILVIGLGLQTLLPIEIINSTVQAIFVVIGLIATAVAERKRRKSTIQPLTLTQSGATLAVAEAPLPTIPATRLP